MFTAQLLTLTLVNAGGKPSVNDYKTGMIVELHSFNAKQYNGCRAKVLDRDLPQVKAQLKPGRIPVKIFDTSGSKPITKNGKRLAVKRVLSLGCRNLRIIPEKSSKRSRSKSQPRARQFERGQLVWLTELTEKPPSDYWCPSYNGSYAIVQRPLQNGLYEVKVILKNVFGGEREQKKRVLPENMSSKAPPSALQPKVFVTVQHNGEDREGVVLGYENKKGIVVGFPKNRRSIKYHWFYNAFTRDFLGNKSGWSYDTYSFQRYPKDELLDKIFIMSKRRRRLNPVSTLEQRMENDSEYQRIH